MCVYVCVGRCSSKHVLPGAATRLPDTPGRRYLLHAWHVDGERRTCDTTALVSGRYRERARGRRQPLSFHPCGSYMYHAGGGDHSSYGEEGEKEGS